MSDELRDDELGEALRGLAVPDHGPDFFNDLARRLEGEPAPGATVGPPRTVRHPARRSPWQRPTVLVGVAAAVVAAVAMAGIILPNRQGEGPGVFRPGVASAAEVRTQVAGALAGLTTLRGHVTVECAVAFGSCSPPDTGGRTSRTWSFVTTADGNERVTGVHSVDDLALQVDQGVQRSITDLDGTVLAEEITGLPAGPPDFAARPSVLRRDVAATVRAFLDSTSDVPVREVVVDGRPAWQLVAEVVPNKLAGPGGSGNALDVVVDRQSGFPLRVTETLDGRFLHEVRLSGLVVDAPVDPDTFTLELPENGETEVFRQDAGFRRVGPDKVAAVVGYQPVLPAELPDGFVRAEVAVASEAQPTGTEGANPPSQDVVSAAYRRGFDRIVVSTRTTGSYELASPGGTGTVAGWDDPLASGEGFVDQPQPFTVSDGALAGAEAELVISARGVPHVWTYSPELITTMGGDVNAEELRRMAASFAPIP